MNLDGPTPESDVLGDDGQGSSLEDTFPVGAPDVAIGGLSIARSLLQQRDDDEDLGDEAWPHWSIFGTITPQPDGPFLLFGDLTVASEEWFAGATAVAVMVSRDPAAARARLSDERSLVQTLGPWASNALYDTAARVVRSLIAASPECSLEVPYLTPRPTLRFPEQRQDGAP